MQKRIHYIEDLSKEDISLIAQLLCFPNPDLPDIPTTSTTSTTASTTTKTPPPPFPPLPWLAHQATTLSNFPPHLLRPTSLLPKLAIAIPLPFAAPQASLCPTHKPLNPFLLRRFFMQLCAETGLRNQALLEVAERERERERERQGQGDDGEHGGEHGSKNDSSAAQTLHPAVHHFLHTLTTLSSLWLSADTYRTKYRAQPHWPRYERVASGCEACILAYVGGNKAAVAALRTSLVGRMRRGHEGRLWGVVEGWVAGLSEGGMREESERVGGLVRKERKRVWRRRRRERRERRRREMGRRWNGGGSSGTPTTTTTITGKTGKKGGESESETAPPGLWMGGGDGAHDERDDDIYDDEREVMIGDRRLRDDGQDGSREAEEQDFEGSIIDYYHHGGGGGRGVDEDALHPALRNSVAYDPVAGTFFHRPQHQHQHQQQTFSSNGAAEISRTGAVSRTTFYTQSAYSQDAVVGGRDPNSGAKAAGHSWKGGNSRNALASTRIKNPFVSKTSSRKTVDRHIAEKRAESYQNLVGIPEEEKNDASPIGGWKRQQRKQPSDEAVREYMRKLWASKPAAAAAEGGEAEEEEDEYEHAEEYGLEYAEAYRQAVHATEAQTQAEIEEAKEEAARNMRVRRALADAHGDDRSRTERREAEAAISITVEERREKRKTHMTTWSSMMQKGGGTKWLGS